MSKADIQSRYILGVRIDFGLNMQSAVEKIADLLRTTDSHIVCTTNPEFVVSAQHDSVFKKIINESALSVPDGFGIVLADEYIASIKKLKKTRLFPAKAFIYGLKLGLSSVFTHNPKQETINGIELVPKLCELAVSNGYTVFLLGGWPKDRFGRMKAVNYDLAEKTAEKLKTLYPGIKIIGATSHYSCQEENDSKVLAYIHMQMKKSGVNNIDIVFLAYPHGAQEKWIKRNNTRIPAKITIGVGGAFDFISGEVQRAPEIVKKMHLEWIYRLISQPWRIRRIYMAFPTFPFRVYKSILRE